jgi:hypothetical protein
MSMSRVELDLMHQLKQLSQRIPSFVIAFTNDDLPVDVEIAFVHQLANIAEGLLRHANARRGLTIDGQPIPFVIDAAFAGVDSPTEAWCAATEECAPIHIAQSSGALP